MANEFSPTSYDAPTKVEPLALRAREAAIALGVSERTLFDLTREGVIPSVRLTNKIVVYPIDVVRRRLAELAEQQAAGQSS